MNKNIAVVVQFLLLVQFFLNQYKIFEPVQNFLNQYKIFWTSTKYFELVQFFCFCFWFCVKQKKSFWHLLSLSSLFSSSLLYLPHLLFPSCSPSIPASILFISMLTLWALNHRPLVFLWIHVLMPYHWAMKTWMQVPLFFNYIYTIVVIHFLKLIHSIGNTFP